jgi:hypothetical protein
LKCGIGVAGGQPALHKLLREFMMESYWRAEFKIPSWQTYIPASETQEWCAVFVLKLIIPEINPLQECLHPVGNMGNIDWVKTDGMQSSVS